MFHFTLAHIVTSLGLVTDIFGAGVLAWGLFIGEDEAVRLSGVSGAAYLMNRPTPQTQMLQQPAVRDRLRQSSRGKYGFALLVIGFALQLIGTWLS